MDHPKIKYNDYKYENPYNPIIKYKLTAQEKISFSTVTTAKCEWPAATCMITRNKCENYYFGIDQQSS